MGTSFDPVVGSSSLEVDFEESIDFNATRDNFVVERNIDEVTTANNLLINDLVYELISLKTHVQKDNDRKKSYTLNYVGSVNNCYHKDIDDNVLSDHLAYKNNYFDAYYNKLNNDFNVFYNKGKNQKKVDDYITNNIFLNDKVFNNINDGVTSLSRNFKNFSLFEEIKNLTTTENYNSSLFGQVSKSVYKNITMSDRFSKLDYSIDFPQKTSISTSNSILNKNTTKEKLMFEIFEDDYNFNISNKPNATVIIIQSFLNVARSLYTIHPNSLDSVLNRELKVTFSETISSNIDKVISNEYNNCDFYKHINEKEGYFNIEKFLKENRDILNTYEPKLQTNGIVLSDYLSTGVLNPAVVGNNTYYQDSAGGRINILSEEPQLDKLVEIFNNDLIPGQYYYPRSFLNYLGRQLFSLYKTKEILYDLEFKSISEYSDAKTALRKYNEERLNYFSGLIEMMLDNAYQADFNEIISNHFGYLTSSTYFYPQATSNYILTEGHLHDKGLVAAGSISLSAEGVIEGRTGIVDLDNFYNFYNVIKLCTLIKSSKSIFQGTSNTEKFARIGKCVYIDKVPAFSYDFKRNKLLYSRSFAVDNKNFIIDLLRDPIKTALKVDSIVKSVKENDIPEAFKDVISNVKSNVNKHIHLPFDKEKNGISVITSENNLFNNLFKDDGDDFYSNIDLFLNKKVDSIKYKSLVESKSSNKFEEVNTDYLKNFVKSYFKKSNFDSSTSLYLNILESIKKESQLFDNINNTSFLENSTLLQAVYFTYINNNKNSDVLNIISKRFVKNAILKSNFSRDNISVKEFKYDFRNIKKSDYDITSEEEVKKHLSDVMESSQSLEKIRKSVFDIENINLVVKYNCNYSTVSNIDLFRSNIHFLENKLIFPYLFSLNYFNIASSTKNKSVNSLTEIKYYSKTKNNIKKRILLDDDIVINPYTQEKIEWDSSESAKNEYFIVDSSIGFDCTLSDKIKASVIFERPNYPNTNTNPTSRLDEKYTLTDTFEELCLNENFVFNNITLLIEDLLHNYIKDTKILKSEIEIDSFIQDNVSLRNIVKQIMIVYSELYLVYFARIQRSISFNNFAWIEDKEGSNLRNIFSHRNLSNQPLTYTMTNFREKLEGISSSIIRDNLYSNINSNDLVSDIINLINNVKSNTEIFLNDNIDMTSNNIESEWKTEVTETLYNVFSILIKSDTNQALSMDFIVLMINYLDKIKSLSYEEMSDNGLLNSVEEIIGQENIKDIKQKIYNPIFVNSLASKSLAFLEKNKELYTQISALESQSLNRKYDGINIYSYLKEISKKNVSKVKIANIEKLLNTTTTGIDDNNALANEEDGDITYTKSKESFLKSDYHTFNLQLEEVFNLSPDSLIILNVNFVDHENLNRVYLPKSFIFSPLITFNKYNNVNELIFYNIFSDNLLDRLINISYDDIIAQDNEIQKYFINLIKNKKPIATENNSLFAKTLYEYIIKCHLGSGQISLINKGINCVDLEYAKNGNTETTDEIINLFTSLDELTFYNTFNITKEKALKHMKKENDNWNLPTIIESFSLGTTFFDNCKALCDITGKKEMQNINNVIYDTYNMHVNPKDFVFFEVYNQDVNLGGSRVYLSDNEKSLLRMYGFDIGILSDKNLYSGVDISNDNYSIEISYEIV